MTASVEGRSLELYFIDGKPDGMLTAEVFNWTGHVLMAPRTRLSAMLARKEANYTGVYILIGEQEGEPLAYIGEGEDISYRIKNHDANKDWWTQAVLVTSTANNLHKAHVKYLEARLIEEARSIKRMGLQNGTTPSRPGLSESAQSNMEAFLDYLLMVLPALRIDMFVRNTRVAKPAIPSAAPTTAVEFELVSIKRDLKATAILTEGEFIVEAGSRAISEWTQNPTHGYAALHADLVKQGVLPIDGKSRVFNKSYAFASPSAAAAVILGRAANGTTEWKVKNTDLTYKAWELAQISLPVELDL
jgi:Domain of unknown function (DUF4357)